MLRLLRFLLTGDWHLHRWEILYKTPCKGAGGGLWDRHYCRCTVCGQIKKFD